MFEGPASRVMVAYRNHFGERATAAKPEEVTRGELAELIASRVGRGG